MNKNFTDLNSRLDALKQDVVDKHLQGYENLKQNYDRIKQIGEEGLTAFGTLKSGLGIKKLRDAYLKRKGGEQTAGENENTAAGEAEAEVEEDIPKQVIDKVQIPELGSGTIGPQQFTGDLGERAMTRIRSAMAGRDTLPERSIADEPSATGPEIEMTELGREDIGGGAGGGLRDYMSGVFNSIKGNKVVPMDRGTLGSEVRAQVQDFGDMANVPAELEGQGVSRYGMLKSGFQRNVQELRSTAQQTAEDFGEIPAELQGQGVSRFGMLKSGMQRNLSEFKDAFNSTAEDVKGAASSITDAAEGLAGIGEAETGIQEASAVASAVPGVGDVVAGLGEVAGAGLGVYGIVQEAITAGKEATDTQNLQRNFTSNISRANVIPTLSSTYQMPSMSSF